MNLNENINRIKEVMGFLFIIGIYILHGNINYRITVKENLKGRIFR
jgi:hypothetical protein